MSSENIRWSYSAKNRLVSKATDPAGQLIYVHDVFANIVCALYTISTRAVCTISALTLCLTIMLIFEKMDTFQQIQ